MKNSQSPPQAIELWIRSFTPTTTGRTHERALEQLERLESSLPIERVDVRIWGSEIECTARSRRVPQLAEILDRLEAFEEWAAESGRRLEPFFRRRRAESTITGECKDVHRLPTIALAEYDGGEVVHVAPCLDGERTVDVFDRLDALGDGRRTDSALRFEDDSADEGDRPSGDSLETESHRTEPSSPHSG
ncbi:HTH domain-containing protein [Natrarchaeobius oligotrophus]|uniref:Uncharacterized protein n=1 Tax=Natrarchaeobius chitinivorans TaxID=1679083 RepID=A0A3N6MY02_NATCH|nr:HTH domain-containing protein [Natrarchaeobius chitinivorans]RQH01322.1 hypothetical protein EA472_07695 [Natrarchaeobius chitinivorans]